MLCNERKKKPTDSFSESHSERSLRFLLLSLRLSFHVSFVRKWFVSYFLHSNRTLGHLFMCRRTHLICGVFSIVVYFLDIRLHDIHFWRVVTMPTIEIRKEKNAPTTNSISRNGSWWFFKSLVNEICYCRRICTTHAHKQLKKREKYEFRGIFDKLISFFFTTRSLAAQPKNIEESMKKMRWN